VTKHIGKQTVQFAVPPVILSTGTAVGPYEAAGPLGDYFDTKHVDPLAGAASFEKAERQMLLDACLTALHKINATPAQVQFLLAGDLLNQIITSGFAALELTIPFFGIYGACSTAVEGLTLGSMILDGGFGERVLAATSSHNSTAERQFRYPTEYGTQRKPSSQWTVTGAGAALLGSSGLGPRITYATVGKVVDMACNDPLNLGAAMAPAAVDTLSAHFNDTGRQPLDYDLILTGDLGKVGHELAIQWMKDTQGLDLSKNYQDCGMLIYDLDDPRVGSGGSGCGCFASVVYGYVYQQLLRGNLKKVLLVATGAMHSPLSCQQGENIPCVAQAISLEM
jgi:stage V sporulation protein AD